MDAPEVGTIEISLIGPGFGESIVAHVGDGKWIVIDSCTNPNTGACAPLEYLESMGVDVKNDVIAVIISHYDDDHIAGMPRLLEEALAAAVVISPAYTSKDFYKFVARLSSPQPLEGLSGVSNIDHTLEILMTRRRKILAAKNKQIFSEVDFPLSHGAQMRLLTLSPCDAEIETFLSWIASEMPTPQTTRRVLPKRIRNDVSIVVDLRIGDDQILFGADLEEEGDPETGWSAVISHNGRHPGKAQIYKVAHHGSISGDHADIWTELLDGDPITVVAPWINGGRVLPGPADRDRIMDKSNAAFVTSTARMVRPKKRGTMIDQQIKSTATSHKLAKAEFGIVRLRRPVSSRAQIWSVEMIATACRLEDWPMARQAR